MAILMDITLKATLLLVTAGAAALLMRRASAASRHLLWTGVFGAVLLLPVARFALPPIPVAVLAPEEMPLMPTATSRVSVSDVATVAAREARPPAISAVFSSTTAAVVSSGRPAWSATRIITTVWLVVAGLIALRIACGVVWGWTWARRARPVTEVTALSLDRIRMSLRVRRPVRLLVSSEQRMPVTWGVVRPIILLPESVLAWGVESPARLQAVLAHETAHIARWDAVSQLIARLGVAMFWFNPLMWIASRLARLERERACDDAVLELGTRPSDYAGHLVAVAQLLPNPASVGASGLAMARRSQLERRVRAILDEHANRRGVSRVSLALVSALVVATLPVSAVSLTARQIDIASVRAAVQVPTPAMSRQSPMSVAPAMKVVTPKRARSLPDTPDPLTALVPVEIQSLPLPQIPVGGFSAPTWREDRAALLQQLLDRARQHHRDQLKKAEIGTMASIETLTAETVVVNLEAAIADANRADQIGVLSDRELVQLRRALEVALRNLDAEERRMAEGRTTSYNLSMALLNTVSMLLRAMPTADADLLAALRRVATVESAAERANALVSLAERNALTPEMVSLYVAAASAIPVAAERERVFAQPIRVKPQGR